jgi:hypothetical protein
VLVCYAPYITLSYGLNREREERAGTREAKEIKPF